MKKREKGIQDIFKRRSGIYKRISGYVIVLLLLIPLIIWSGCEEPTEEEPQDTLFEAASDIEETTSDVTEDQDQIIDFTCTGEDSLVFDSEGGRKFSTKDLGALTGVGMEVLDEVFSAETSFTFSCVDSITPEGVIPLSPAIQIATEHPHLNEYITVTLPFASSLLPENAKSKAIRIFMKRPDSDRVFSPPLPNIQEYMEQGLLQFNTKELAIFQIGVAENAGQPYTRHFTYRGISGVSMGGGGASMVAFKNPDFFDFVGILGGAADWIYLVHYIMDGGMAGFCPAPDFGLCETKGATEEFERMISFEQWYSPQDEGSGGTFDRSEYVKIFQDLSMGFGNMLSYNTESPYLPPGVPFSELHRTQQEQCAEHPDQTFTIESGYFDDEYNPDGTLPVIMFCDGEDGDPEGYFDDSVPHSRPFEIGLAVDVNGNGRRDSGEPVIRTPWESFDDVGIDGVPDEEEPGYDAETNQDPNDDNYDYVTNPFGTEGNWLHEEGEPFRDDGLDGVPGTPQLADGGYDYGENNGEFDYNPNVQTVWDRTPIKRISLFDQEDFDNMTIYMDGGIRDLFNFEVAGNQLAGTMQGHGANFRIYDQFHNLAQVEPGDRYPFIDIDYSNLGDHVYIRYGNPRATEEEIEMGDGAHVGTVPQAANRFLTLLGFFASFYPDGELTQIDPPYSTPNYTLFFQSELLNGQQKYSIVLPPGYDDEGFEEARYPVMYLMHGYGMAPEDLQITVLPFSGYMAGGYWPKIIIVYPEGYCGNNSVTQCSDGIDNDNDGTVDTADPNCGSRRDLSESGEPNTFCTDGVDNDEDGLVDMDDRGCITPESNTEADCKKGTFYMDHKAWPSGLPDGPQYEQVFFELVEHIDANYRTKAPADVTLYR